jgi:hypothetical protein
MTEAKKDPVPVFVLKRLGSQAPEFDMPVDIQKLDGTPARLTLRCKALKKTEWAGIKDARQREAIEATLKADETTEERKPVQTSKKSGGKGKDAERAETPQVVDRAEMRAAVLKTLAENGFSAAVDKALEADTTIVMKFAIGWELEDEFSAANITALDNEFAGSMEAILNAYDRAIFRGQVGNSKP